MIFHQSVGSLNKDKRTGFRRSHNPAAATEKATCLEFGVMTLEGDGMICGGITRWIIADT